MKKLIIIRHAKSDWQHSNEITDIDRPLNVRGVNDAHKMAMRLFKQSIVPDMLLASSGIRALHTAVIMARIMENCQAKIKVASELYHATANTIQWTIQKQVPNTVNTLFVFAHNPGVSEFAYQYNRKFLENMPTCAMVGFNCEIEDWAHLDEELANFWFYDFPKRLL